MELTDTSKLITPFEFVKPDLDEMEKLIRHQVEDSHYDLGKALNHLLSSGGKRVRPTITILTGKCLKADYESVITMAGAIELLHTATLVHDDLIDGSLLRRGSPTLNSQWSAGATVLTGDFLFASAAKLASETRSNDVMILFSDTLRTIVNGEISQMFTSRCKPGIDEYYKRIYAKTASLFETSALAAAIISGADEKTRNSLSNYGREIGMAFQIEDDILDFTGDEAVMGKPKGSDLRQGLITLPAQVFFENNSSHPLVKKILEFGCLNENDDVNHLVSDILDSDSIEKSHKIADGFIDRSGKALNNIPDSIEKEMLANLSQAQLRRKQ
jgi:geranylgeranyl pyrophosphate synthase